MNRYSDYTDTGIEWIGEIPSGWKCVKLKYITTSKRKLTKDGTETLLSVTEENGIVPRSQIRSNEDHLSRSDDLKGYLKVQEGDLVNNIMLVWKRGLGVSKYEGIVSPAYSVFAFKKNMNSNYFHYLLRSDEYIAEFKRNSTGIVDSRLRLYNDSFGRVFSHVPPLQEQTLISKYLDKKTYQIDSLIEKIEQKIELLKEQRTSLINQCVTKGLDPDVEMKDSGAEWIGEMPNHWELKKLKYIVSYNTEALTDKTDPNYEFTYIEIGDVDYIDGISYRSRTVFSDSPSRARRVLRNGDVIISTVRTYLRAIGLIDREDDLIGSTGFCVLRSSKEVSEKYLSYAVRSKWFISDVISNSEGVSYPGINSSDLVNLKVTLPPLNEQIEIENILDVEIERSDDLISKETKRVELLKEYRQSLISNFVTGKLRVTEDMI